MNINWRIAGRVALCLGMVASLALILGHWHATSRGPDCGVCNVQQMPGVPESPSPVLANFGPSEWVEAADQIRAPYSALILIYHDRAPPASGFSI